MKKFAVIAAAFMLSTALVVVQAGAMADNGISQFQPVNSKIIQSGKAKTSFSAKHKKQKKHHIKAHVAPSFISEQAKENTPSEIRNIQISRARLIKPVFDFDRTESMARSNSYNLILKTRK